MDITLEIALEYLAQDAEEDPWLALIQNELNRLRAEVKTLRAQLWRDERPIYAVVAAPDPFERLSSADELTDIGLSYRDVDAALQRQNAPDAFECLTGRVEDSEMP